MTQFAKGSIAMVLACLAWGLSPVYYALFQAISPAEILAHRTLWSVVTFVTLLVLTGRTKQTLQVVRQPRVMGLILLAGVMIAINWYVFIFSVSVGRVTESSLGYYIFPLVMVLSGACGLSRNSLNLAVGRDCFGQCGRAGFDHWPGRGALAGFDDFFELWSLWPAQTDHQSGFHRLGYVRGGITTTHCFGVSLCIRRSSGHKNPSGVNVFGAYYGRPPRAHDLCNAARSDGDCRIASISQPNLAIFLCAIVILGEVITGWHIIAIALIWIALVFYWLAVFRAERKTVSISSTV